ncbi:hypothetical protein D9757_003351 [Collybiopsis confluens]|uniref:Uncharacterized protein n=1 Tax=Collybiopsis confluens TaxID=2823264 RepID=A0A8H5HZ56_9AGAR|nr:hypothetical protein D9757_003351 [Collybiopsis confluens]
MPVHTTALLEAFLNSNSKALYNFPSDPRVFLTSFFLPDSPTSMRPIPQPQSMWTINDHASLGIWAVFKTHEEACAILSLPPTNMNIAPALESDLEPFHKLSRFHLDSPSAGPLPPQRCPPMLHIQDSPLSSNPPNPRSNFRATTSLKFAELLLPFHPMIELEIKISHFYFTDAVLRIVPHIILG